MYDSPVHDWTQEQTVSHTFRPSFDNANGRLCQERLLRSRIFLPWQRDVRTTPLCI